MITNKYFHFTKYQSLGDRDTVSSQIICWKITLNQKFSYILNRVSLNCKVIFVIIHYMPSLWLLCNIVMDAY